ncbi:MAG: DUF2188 domain-containing protein [Saprospiraceae bacterium]|nr:DUF2188 domain-containing protein [Saprospiraceae bacterium]
MMTDIRKGKFWSNLLKKIVRILVRNISGGGRTTHNQHVVPHEDGWAVKGAGNERITAVYEKQSQAIDRARDIAKNYRSSVIIHGRDGAIRDRMHYD